MAGFPKQRNQIQRIALTRRLSVFLVTSVACLAVLCLLWPLGVRQFRSSVVVHLRSNAELGTTDLVTGLVQCVRTESEPDRIAELIERTAEQVILQSNDFEARDVDAIQRGIQVGAERHGTDGSINFIIAFDGEGFSDQSVFLDQFAARVTRRFQSVRHSPSEGLVSAWTPETLVAQVDQALAAAAEMESMSGGQPLNSESGNQFRMVSSSRVVASPAGIGTAVNPGSDLNCQLIHLRQAIAQLANQQPAFTVLQTGPAATRALDSTPPAFLLGLIVIGSVIAGSMTAKHYRPFARAGFDSVDAIARQLKLPISAKLETSETSDRSGWSSARVRDRRLWPQRVADISGWFVFALTLIVGGFLIIDVTIRDAFFQNPFDGLARIVRVFIGY